MRLDLDITPDPFRAAGAVTAFGNAISDKVQAATLAKVAELYQLHEARHLDTEGKSTGEKFAPLSESRARRKASGRRILEDTGRMRKGLERVRVSGRGMVGGLTRGKQATKAFIHLRGSKTLPIRPTFRADLSTSGAEKGGTSVPLGNAILQIQLAEILKASRKSPAQVLKPFGMERVEGDPRKFRTQ